MVDINELKFDEKGLIPAIVKDAVTGKVLTLAYMNEESLKISMEKELTCFGVVRGRNCGSKGRRAATTSTSSPSPPTATRMRWW